MKVSNMVSRNGNKIPNQFIIDGDGYIIFQSYNSIIAKKENGQIYLDEKYWNYSNTTSKYLRQFLNDIPMPEIKKNVSEGKYILINLN